LGDYILHSNGCQELSIVYALIRTQQALFIGHIANDNNAPEIKLTEEQIREKYPWDTKELTKSPELLPDSSTEKSCLALNI
jgi:hypothetical protein